jgi:hypothetical protein
MRAYAPVEIGDREAIDIFLDRDEAFSALKDVIRGEPEWSQTLYVAPIELDFAADACSN